jgi:flagellar biosynthesis/type III secretory pathway protein FliH
MSLYEFQRIALAAADAPTGGAGGEAGAPAAAGAGEEPPPSTAAPEADVAPASTAAEGSDAPAAVAAPEAPKPAEKPAEKPVDWRDRRIAQLTAQLHAERAKLARLTPATEPPAESPEASAAAIEARAQALAAERVAQQEFNRRCNEAAIAGRAAFGEAAFNERIQNLTQLVDKQDPASVASYTTFIDATLETGEAPRLLYQLGADLNEAARLLALPPVKMALELAKLAVKPAPAEPSKAPKPITPIGGKGAANESIDPTDPERAGSLSTAEWMRRREKQIAERRKFA